MHKALSKKEFRAQYRQINPQTHPLFNRTRQLILIYRLLFLVFTVTSLLLGLLPAHSKFTQIAWYTWLASIICLLFFACWSQELRAKCEKILVHCTQGLAEVRWAYDLHE
jgi:uncharacterized membrane protein